MRARPLGCPHAGESQLVLLRVLVCTITLWLLSVATALGDTLQDLSYGPDPKQRMDVYLPDRPAVGRPVLIMVHGGAWRFGDKSHRAVWKNKRDRWVSQGWVLVSVNYPMLPATPPDQQRQSLALALQEIAQLAPSWQADPAKLVLMGHSAGAHLVSLLATAGPPSTPVAGTVLLDSAALDLPLLMSKRHPRLYDRAFGDDPDYWRDNSAYHALDHAKHHRLAPMLLVCSSKRDNSCPQSRAFAAKAQQLGVRAEVLAEDLSHGAINSQLGLDSAYTQQVEAFLFSLLDHD